MPAIQGAHTMHHACSLPVLKPLRCKVATLHGAHMHALGACWSVWYRTMQKDYSKDGAGRTLAGGSLSTLMGSASVFCLPSGFSILGSLAALASFGAASRRGGGGRSSSMGAAAFAPFSLSSGGGPLRRDQQP